VAVFRSPEAKQPFRVLANPNADGSQLVFLVRRRIPGWTQVALPIRPNGSRGWVRTPSVTLSLDPYRITISLGKHQITLWKGSRMVVRERAGVGRSVLPTPRGVYYIAELLKQPDPGGVYGPYAFGLSAHSNVLYSFGGGAGQIGIHGTNEPDLLGTDVSHGCIRVANSRSRDSPGSFRSAPRSKSTGSTAQARRHSCTGGRWRSISWRRRAAIVFSRACRGSVRWRSPPSCQLPSSGRMGNMRSPPSSGLRSAGIVRRGGTHSHRGSTPVC
jgi:hypothetical protein